MVTLDIWPALPLIIRGDLISTSSTDRIAAALGHSSRVCEVDLVTDHGQLEKVLAAMQVPFPEMTELRLKSLDETPPTIPDSFLGGSAPRQLRFFRLEGIPFPGLPKLILSATHLVYLALSRIPHSGYFSPETMVTFLSVLSGLDTLSLGFESPQSYPHWESKQPPALKCSVIPSLTYFFFRGVSDYLEDLMTRIDTPKLNDLRINCFNQIDFDTPQLAQFINRTPTLRAPNEAQVVFDNRTVDLKLTNRTNESGCATSRISISCKDPDWQLSSISQICNFCWPPLSVVADLYIDHPRDWENDAIENTAWLELLRPFTAVKNLYLTEGCAPGIAAALQEVVGVTGVVSDLQNIFVKGLEPQGPVQKHIGEFVAVRQLSGHPVALSLWNKE